jgi:hypothetical protein
LPSLLAILAVTSLIVALYVWRGEDPKQPPTAASSHTLTPSATPPPATTNASATAEKTADPTVTTSPTATATRTASPDLRSEVAIVVLNETTRGGLAATVAARLRAKGWNVSGVGNFRGVVPATTVYYPDGHADAAQAAAKSLPTPVRIRPRFGNLSTTRLTVVVTTNYPS